ncbi:uncharacterized protein LOC123258229 [Drosophila ananassae]|uniref:uncharacterized protein LOC123258229 n=1 Tax=Drosophila ananassae TaxID=7217 RepID=UPI001CFFC515|nr:uncharacterized protein LOC123258229 [Drosophila ananassae]
MPLPAEVVDLLDSPIISPGVGHKNGSTSQNSCAEDTDEENGNYDAVHLEVVTDLTIQAFLAALKRFCGRRGLPAKIYSDNATNFVGACNELSEVKEAIFAEEAQALIHKTCANLSIEFKFIPPRAPHFGGLWEAAVKSAKHLLKRTLYTATLTHEELETIVIDIEAILNSRPLTSVSSSPRDLTALTPGHFLIGEPLTASPDIHQSRRRTGLLTRWKRIEQLRKEFWTRWSHEYLHELQNRSKWPRSCKTVKIGDLVIIKEDNIAPLNWPLGRIVAVHPGKDGEIRVAEIRTTFGNITRAIHRLAVLPINDKKEEPDL